MRNTYLTGHFPFISILLYSAALAFFTESVIIATLDELGVYRGMTEIFSVNGVKLTLLFLLVLFFFMVFAALKLIADTIVQLSLLFFSKETDGSELVKARPGSWFYLIGSMISLVFFQQIIVVIVIFGLASLGYFIYFVYKISEALTLSGLIGFIFFHVFFWFAFLLTVMFALVKLYNSFVASLPI